MQQPKLFLHEQNKILLNAEEVIDLLLFDPFISLSFSLSEEVLKMTSYCIMEVFEGNIGSKFLRILIILWSKVIPTKIAIGLNLELLFSFQSLEFVSSFLDPISLNPSETRVPKAFLQHNVK